MGKAYSKDEQDTLSAVIQRYKLFYPEQKVPLLFELTDKNEPKLQLTKESVTNFHFVATVPRGLVAGDAEAIVGEIANYQKYRLTKWAGGGRLDDPRALVAEELKEWATNKLYGFVFGAQATEELKEVKRRSGFVLSLFQTDSLFPAGRTGSLTMRGVLGKVREILQSSVIPHITAEIAISSARDHMKQLSINLVSLSTHGTLFLASVFRDLANEANQNFTFVRSAGLQPASLNTRALQLTRCLAAPAIQAIASVDSREQTALSTRVVAVNAEPTQIVPLFDNPFLDTANRPAVPLSLLGQYGASLHNWLRAKGESPSGIVLPLLKDDSAVNEFGILHAHFVTIAQLSRLVNDMYRLAGLGGDLLVYGAANKQVVGILTATQATIKEVEASVDTLCGFGERLLSELVSVKRAAKYRVWQQNFSVAMSVANQIRDECTRIREIAHFVLGKANEVPAQRRIEEVKESLLQFVYAANSFSTSFTSRSRPFELGRDAVAKRLNMVALLCLSQEPTTTRKEPKHRNTQLFHGFQELMAPLITETLDEFAELKDVKPPTQKFSDLTETIGFSLKTRSFTRPPTMDEVHVFGVEVGKLGQRWVCSHLPEVEIQYPLGGPREEKKRLLPPPAVPGLPVVQLEPLLDKCEWTPAAVPESLKKLLVKDVDVWMPTVAFLGTTASGKSYTIGRLLGSSVAKPVRGLHDQSQSADVWLFTEKVDDKHILTSRCQLLDFEGENGTYPAALGEVHWQMKTAEGLDVTWQRRAEAVSRFLPAIGYGIANCVVYVSQEQFFSADYVRQCTQFALRANSAVTDMPARPALILLRNLVPVFQYKQLEDEAGDGNVVKYCTSLFFKTLPQHDPAQKLKMLFSSIYCVPMPVRVAADEGMPKETVEYSRQAYQRALRYLRATLSEIIAAVPESARMVKGTWVEFLDGVVGQIRTHQPVSVPLILSTLARGSMTPIDQAISEFSKEFKKASPIRTPALYREAVRVAMRHLVSSFFKTLQPAVAELEFKDHKVREPVIHAVNELYLRLLSYRPCTARYTGSYPAADAHSKIVCHELAQNHSQHQTNIKVLHPLLKMVGFSVEKWGSFDVWPGSHEFKDGDVPADADFLAAYWVNFTLGELEKELILSLNQQIKAETANPGTMLVSPASASPTSYSPGSPSVSASRSTASARLSPGPVAISEAARVDESKASAKGSNPFVE